MKRYALVTGASRGIGRAIAIELAKDGCSILLNYKSNHVAAEEAKRLIEEAGGEAELMPFDVSQPDAMQRALDDAKMATDDIDYVNAPATSTRQGDEEEAKALTRLFSQKSKVESQKPFISSTKSMTGHENWMAGASEAIYSILMMQNDFVAPNINLENVIDEAKDLNIVRETIYTPIRTVLSNSSGMGGTNSALVFRKVD